MATVYYISHPDVIIYPVILVPQWDLSERGHQRLDLLLTQPWLKTVQAVFCSGEQKAKTTARRIAQHLGLQEQIMAALGEVDRPSTGYLQRGELELVVEALYTHPNQSIRGWERAIDAQKRVVNALEHIMNQTPVDSTIALIGHGGVGTLLLNHFKSIGITRADAPPGQGYYFAFDWENRDLIHAWRPIDLVD